MQLAKRAGARVIGLASSEEKRALVERLGADADGRLPRRGPQGRRSSRPTTASRVDVVLEMSGGDAFDAELAALAPARAAWSSSGSPPASSARSRPRALMRGSKAVIGFWLIHLLAAAASWRRAMIGELLGAVAAGELEVDGRRRLPALGGGAARTKT